MARFDWKFPQTASKLAEAAAAKKASHEARKKWWEDKKAETMTKVRETGIEIRDSVAASYSTTKGNFGPQIEIESGLQRDLSECHSKIQEHDRFISEYDGWCQVLSANPELLLDLYHEDFLYFFGK